MKHTCSLIALIFSIFAIIFTSEPALAATQFDIVGPAGSGAFGANVTALPNGNIVVVDPSFNNYGAVYLYNGATGALISTLRGDSTNDRVGGFGITVLPNGNFLVISPNWHTDAGAVTFCSQTTGCSGIISAANSLVGSALNDRVGWFGAIVLANGNYVVNSSYWNGERGAFTWGSATTGVAGVVSAANSMVGTTPADRVGAGSNGNNGIQALANGNYVAVSSAWNSNRGAATFCSGAAPACVGTISSSNSLVGSTSLDSIGIRGILELANGNYVVRSPEWNNGATPKVGAATWGSGTTGVSGEVSVSNSLTGTTNRERIGSNGLVALTNGNYVVLGPRGVTFGNGTAGTTGEVSAANSLVGTSGGDLTSSSVVALTNGNYVVICPSWTNPSTLDNGAVTFGNGATGTVGEISSSNSLVRVGTASVTPLVNGNYVVTSLGWNAARGAVTFGNGTTGVTGTLSAANSLVGTTSGDRVGADGVTALANGNYVVSSSDWDNGNIFNAGAVTLGSGTSGIVGEVSAANSLVGTHTSDEVGNTGVLALPNGNYVVRSPEWNEFRGAATWGNGTSGVSGELSAANSLVGSSVNDYVAYNVQSLANGNYVVVSQNWNGVRGAVTFGNGAAGTSGAVSAANSLVGVSANDRVGGGNNLRGVITLPNGNYVVPSPNWNGELGAVTWVNGTTGLTGAVTAANSLVGSASLDLIGNGSVTRDGINLLPGGNYAVFSPVWNNGAIENAGAVSLGKPNAPLTGAIAAGNSVRGNAANAGVALTFAYDIFNRQLIVGRQAENIVTVFRYESERRGVYDFDGDGKTDVSIFRPAVGEWWQLRSSDGGNRAAQFGASTDKIAPGDFTGDGRTDIAFFRPSTGEWYILRSEDGSFFSFPFGAAGDIPMPADYDGDGKTDAAVFRPGSGTWYILNSGGSGTSIVGFGSSEDKPVAADYDGDGKADIAIFRPSDGSWWYLRSSDLQFRVYRFGLGTDKPVPGDWTGDGKADIAVFRPSTGEWFFQRSEDNSYYSLPFGAAGDIAAPGDYDGDGRFDTAVFRPSGATWYVQRSTAGLMIVGFGASDDKPVASAFIP